MKKYLVIIALLMVSVAAHADNLFSMPATSGSSSNSAGTANAANSGIGNGAQLQVNTTNNGGGDSTIRTTPTVYTSSYGSFSAASCMVSGAAGISLVGLGASGTTPIDGEHCDYRLNIQQAVAVAMTASDFLKAWGDKLPDEMRAQAITKIQNALDAAQDATCLYSDRQRAVMEAHDLCQKVANFATLDHRWNQPRSTQIDYATEPSTATTIH